MKKIFKYLFGCVLAFMVNSCDHSIIDLKPISENNVSSFYETLDDMEIALTGLYRGMRTLYQPNYLDLFSETRSDNAINYFTTVGGGVYADFDNFSLGASNASLNSFWVACYSDIQRANIIINRIEKVSFSDENRQKRILGEAKFIRALIYFHLVRLWGDVPLVVEEIEDPTVAFAHARSSQGDVYEQIIADLTQAESNLPEIIADADFGRASKWAAKGILAKVLLTKNEYSAAKSKLSEIVAADKFQLLSDFKKVFEYSLVGNKEIIFAIRFMKSTQGAGYPRQNVNHDFQCSASFDFMNTFSTDPRLDATIDTSDIGIFYSPKKISFDYGSDNTTDINRIELRMADIYLMMAEVLNQTGGEVSEILYYLNLVRERAGLDGFQSSDFASQEEILDAILKERRIEFAFEDQRWFDLLRTGKTLEIMNSKLDGGSNSNAASALPYNTITENQLLYPVPQNQIDASGGSLNQNPGY